MKRIVLAFVGMLVTSAAFSHGVSDGMSEEMDGKTCPVCNGAGTCQPAGYRGSQSNKTYCWGSGKCGFCGGDGYTYVAGNLVSCVTCNGKGKCAKCNGTGKCHNCHGSGKVGGFSGGGSSSSSDSSMGDSALSGSGGSGASFMSGDGMEGLAVALAAVLILPISYAVVGYTAIKERHEWSPVFPDLQAQAGWSYLLGEHVAVRTHLGGASGLVLTGGVGREILTKIDSHNKVNSFMGVGWFLSDNYNVKWDFSWTIDAILSSQRYVAPIAFTTAEYTRYFGNARKHGAFVGLGAGYGSEFAADFRIGYVYRILHW